MKKFSRQLLIMLMMIGCIQISTSFGQDAFAISEKSNVGITFKSNMPQQKTNNSDVQTQNSKKYHEMKSQKLFPMTNELKNHFFMLSVWLLIGGLLLWIFFKRRKKETEQ
ncbi:LPXTG cell wall anchor domain-containing protein [Enterococcus faecalis]|uniref:LPXTG cell wall anchor domain-containing protein n=1 Tax=Enterococcus TaxID=1350 RepID=UPI00027C7733|nr:LPXTG cell wall anchor domain-containing protein [Enterococcus faecalis]EJV36620.1 LPXTG-motif protein cell wall anchor domain protein [Enterococcus faecalis R508]EKZ0375491.1 LPXTG cell wall anchor domain-containing protein [Enterococcus faecalis]EME5817361.1 LPXTG cell wall anchor domain-containing protein [Enterococcus faecalis]EPH63321.1 LPXTG-motif protein cell wall anchor domain protein [Enterococcus faecalis KI-6-1-110608-1]MEB8383785.1 LPXTG cell wall anchor domain-containing protei